MRAVYLDSSAVVKLVVAEPGSAALRTHLRRRQPLVSSALARTEVLRALLPAGEPALARGREVLRRLDLVRINDRILDAAAVLPPAQMRSLDAIHLATAPKSNRAALAVWSAREDVRAGKVGEVPAHLRDASYRSARIIGHGKGYRYPHDDPRGWVAQQHLPDGMGDVRYYEPSDHGDEQEVARRMAERRADPGNEGRGG